MQDIIEYINASKELLFKQATQLEAQESQIAMLKNAATMNRVSYDLSLRKVAEELDNLKKDHNDAILIKEASSTQEDVEGLGTLVEGTSLHIDGLSEAELTLYKRQGYI